MSAGGLRVVVSAWLGAGNLGDELIFSSLLARLRRHDVAVVGVSLDPAATTALHRIGSVGHGDLRRVRRALRRADAHVFGGGGLMQDASSWLSPLYQAARPWYGRRLGLPTATVGLGVGPLRLGLSRRIARRVLSDQVGVAVRDRASAQLLRRIGVDDVVEAADLVLGLPTPTGDSEDVATVAIRPGLAPGGVLPGRWRKQPAGVRSDAAALAASLDEVHDRTGLGLRFVAFEPRRDEPFQRLVAERLRAAPAEVVVPALDDVVALVARSRVVLAGRYHAGVVAALAGRPSVLLGDEVKLASLAGDLGPATIRLPAGVTTMLGAATESVLDRGDDAVAARDRLRDRERNNARVIERLLDVAARRSRGR